ncbi:hypothetical protein VTN31DRAFT_2221 [Thermomyces dupontii]|uniref:uncharacterized protein n=1 Tax=Talaromyces thermophilus TaxID=28565 RepID=UPI003741EE1A
MVSPSGSLIPRVSQSPISGAARSGCLFARDGQMAALSPWIGPSQGPHFGTTVRLVTTPQAPKRPEDGKDA